MNMSSYPNINNNRGYMIILMYPQCYYLSSGTPLNPTGAIQCVCLSQWPSDDGELLYLTYKARAYVTLLLETTQITPSITLPTIIAY